MVRDARVCAWKVVQVFICSLSILELCHSQDQSLIGNRPDSPLTFVVVSLGLNKISDVSCHQSLGILRTITRFENEEQAFAAILTIFALNLGLALTKQLMGISQGDFLECLCVILLLLMMQLSIAKAVITSRVKEKSLKS